MLRSDCIGKSFIHTQFKTDFLEVKLELFKLHIRRVEGSWRISRYRIRDKYQNQKFPDNLTFFLLQGTIFSVLRVYQKVRSDCIIFVFFYRKTCVWGAFIINII